MFIETRKQKPSQPQRGVMDGQVQAMTHIEKNAARNISPGWGKWYRRGAQLWRRKFHKISRL